MPGDRLRRGLRPLGALLVVALTMACSAATDLVTPRHTVAGLLARAPSPGQSVEIDAYLSGGILSDQPYRPELQVLGTAQANPLPDDEPWLVAEAGPAISDLAQLPYRGRLRGHLREPSAAARGTTAGRTFVVERVVRVRVQHRPAPASSDEASWRRRTVVEGGYSVPVPPRWGVEQPDPLTLIVRAPQWPDCPIMVRVHPSETHHDPYEPAAAPPLLRGRTWSILQQAAGGQRLSGYRFDSAVGPAERVATVLFSGHGRTFELSVRYRLGLSASQTLLTAYTAIAAGFRLDVLPGPSPTPPVRQALGPGPFLSQEEALRGACDSCGNKIEAAEAQLVTEAEARRLAGPCRSLAGHYDGLWVLTVHTPAAGHTGRLRLFLDAASGRELCREEIEPATGTGEPASAAPPPGGGALVAAVPGPRKWIEVDLRRQTLTAWEGDAPVRQMLICSGVSAYPTVTGEFRIYRKIVSMTMSGPGYVIPGVPHCLYFHEGYAIHGAYWRSSFGFPASHGCVNVSLPDAAWLFAWTAPELAPDDGAVEATICNPGTLVVVH